MANIRSAIKNARKSRTRALRNKAAKTSLKTLAKSLAAAVKSGDAASAKNAAIAYASALDKAAKGNVIHRNTASHHKSQIAKYIFA